MRKRIHLTESQLYGLVKQAINETNFRNTMGAFDPYHPQGDTPPYQGARQKNGKYKTMRAPNPYDDDYADDDGWYRRKAKQTPSGVALGRGGVWADDMAESVMRYIKEATYNWDDVDNLEDDDDWEDEEEEMDDTPRVITFSELMDHGFKPETVLKELEATLSGDQRRALMDSIWDDYDLEEAEYDRDDYEYLTELVDERLLSPKEIIQNADYFFGLGMTRTAAQEMMDLLWNN